MARTAASPDCPCPQCDGQGLLKLDNGVIARYECSRCEHLWEFERIPGQAAPWFRDQPGYAIIIGSADPVAATAALHTLSPERVVGESPYPCPRCRAVTGIHVCYAGRSEKWECDGCGFNWSMPATTEQPQ